MYVAQIELQAGLSLFIAQEQDPLSTRVLFQSEKHSPMHSVESSRYIQPQDGTYDDVTKQ